MSANWTLSIFYLNNTKESAVTDVALALEHITATTIKIFNEKIGLFVKAYLNAEIDKPIFLHDYIAALKINIVHVL